MRKILAESKRFGAITAVNGPSGLVMANMGRTKKALPGDWSGARSDFCGRDKFSGFLFSPVVFRVTGVYPFF